MNYKESVEFINGLETKLDRENPNNFNDFLEFIGNPQDQIKTLHIAGTNGKGSTIQFLSNILIESGYKIGAFISPSLEKLNERFLINNQEISDQTFTEYTNKVSSLVNKYILDGGEGLIEFEFVTTMAFLIFKDSACEISLIETGIGGRFDSTNIIRPLASIITTISKDHEYLLGDNILDIASQKAGIIKDNVPAFSQSHSREIDKIIIKEGEEKNTPVKFLKSEYISNIETNESGSSYDFDYNNISLENIEVNLLGKHQIYNSALAILVLLELNERKILKIDKDSIYKGIKESFWPGRMEILLDEPRLYVEGAHNQEGLNALIENLKNFKYRKLIIGFNMLKDKDIVYFTNKLESVGDIIICTEIDFYRSRPAEEIASHFNKEVIVEKNLNKAINKAIDLATEDDLIIFCGSLHLVGHVRTILKGSN